jgi:hypothetical protein
MEEYPMRILYVEDKPYENIDRIIFLFRKYLSKELVNQLEELNEDESGFGASADEIRQILNSSDTVRFEHNFCDALLAVQNNSEFAMYIIDRNLSDSEYEVEDVSKIEPNFTEELGIEYVKFEGDYLLQKAAFAKIDVRNKFYFLTANPSDSLREIDKIKPLFDFGKFSSSNFIDKSDPQRMENLRNKINNHSQMQIQLDNSEYLEILRKSIGDNAVSEFMKLLIGNNLRIPDALISCRKLLENILAILAEKTKPKITDCWRYKKSKKELILSTFISTITFEEPDRYKSNTTVELAMKHITRISSEFGAHQDLSKENIFATQDTVQSLIYNLKDIILWFGKKMK